MANSNKEKSVKNQNSKCTYDGKEYSDGAVVCQSGIKFKCIDGVWDNTGQKC